MRGKTPSQSLIQCPKGLKIRDIAQKVGALDEWGMSFQILSAPNAILNSNNKHSHVVIL
jgi:hypothetical protein